MQHSNDGDLADRLDRPMMVIAGLAVGLYVGSLSGLWVDLGLEDVAFWVALFFDLLFCADLLLKSFLRGWAYWRTLGRCWT